MEHQTLSSNSMCDVYYKKKHLQKYKIQDKYIYYYSQLTHYPKQTSHISARGHSHFCERCTPIFLSKRLTKGTKLSHQK